MKTLLRMLGILSLPALAVVCLLIAQGCAEHSLHPMTGPPELTNAPLQLQYNNFRAKEGLTCRELRCALISFTNQHKAWDSVTFKGFQVEKPGKPCDTPKPCGEGSGARVSIAQNVGFANDADLRAFQAAIN